MDGHNTDMSSIEAAYEQRKLPGEARGDMILGGGGGSQHSGDPAAAVQPPAPAATVPTLGDTGDLSQR